MALSGANLVHLKKGVPDKKLEIISDDVTIGSDLRCTVRIHKADVERKHCTIKRNGSKVILNNCSQSTNILVNDKLVLSDIELKDNDVLSVSNRKFLWSFNASNFKNKYRRITTFSNRGRNKTNQKIDGRERKSLPLSAYLPISAESPEKQIAIVKPLQSAPVEDVFLMEAAGSYNSSVIGGQNVVSKNLVQKNSNTLNLIKKTPRKSTGARSSRSKILEKLSHSAPKTRDGNKMRMSQRHSLAAVVQTIKDSIKIVNTNIKRNKPMKKATRKSISQNKIVAKTAVKRKFSEEEVINLNNKKRKLNSPVIDAKKKAALMVLKTGEQNHIKPAKSYPQHQYALKVPNSFSFGPVASNFGTGSEKTDKKNNSINEIKENAIGTEGTHNCEVKSSLLENNKKTLRRSSMRCNTSKTENDNIESREQNIVASKNKDCMRKSSIQSGLIEPAFKQSLKYFDKRKSYCTDVATKIKRTNKMLNRSLDSQDSQSSAIDIKSAINNFSEIDEKSMHSTKKDGSFAIDNTEDSILKPSLIEQSTLLDSEGEINDHLPDTSSKIIKLKSAPIAVEPTIQNNSLSRKSIRRSIRASPAKDLIKDRNNATNAKKNVQKEISQSPTYSLENSKTESSFVSDEDNVNTGSKSIFYLDNSVTENSTVDPQFNESLENINSNFCKKRFVNSQNKNGKTPRKSGLFNRSLKKIAEEVSTQSDVLEEAVGKNKIRLSMKRTSLRNSIKKVNTNESEILVDLNMSGPQSESLILEDSSLNDTVFLNSSQEIYNSTSQLNISIQSTEETNANVSKAQNASIQISAAENDLIFEGSENSKIPSKVAEMSLRISSLQENNVEVHNDLNKSEIVMKTKTKRASSVNTKSLNNSSITNLLPEDNVNISHTDNEFNINESKSNSKRSSVLNRKSLRNSVTIKTTEEINASDDLTVEFDHHNQSDYLYPKTKEETLCKSMKVQDNVKSPVKRFSLKSVHGVQELGINNDHINQINENLNIASSVKQKRLSNYIIDSVQEPSDIELSQSDIELSTHEIHLDDAPIFDSEHRDENNLKDSGLHNNSRLEKYSNNSFKTQKRNSARIFNTRKSLSALTSGKSLCNSDVLINTSLPCPSLKTSDQLHDGLLNKIQKSHLSMSNNTFSSSDSLSHMTNMNEKLIEDNTNSIKRNSLRVSNVNSYVNQLDGKLNTSEHLLKDLNQTLMESSPLQTKSVNNSINLDQNATNVQGDEIVVVNESILSDKSMLDTAEQIIDYTDETLSKYNVSYPEDDAETTSRKSLRSGSRAASAVKHILLNPINQNVSMNHKTRRKSLQFLPSKNPQYQKQKLNASLPFKLNSRKSKLLNQSLNNGLKMNTNERKSESMTTLSDIENQLENTNTTLPDILSETF
ncbi:reticulocyte-binding protein 2-like isoform X2 [Ctenocephalides felis]|uniref:reticulocyte-binding protein 2-like isoform X2 n=1 Tax=Ctenocephalides felis TaxID=7515 RepID=UPI000E6E3F10|nr:reticulocyte-binding protein 2-like isoform X2 [Ctenocephalides felis]